MGVKLAMYDGSVDWAVSSMSTAWKTILLSESAPVHAHVHVHVALGSTWGMCMRTFMGMRHSAACGEHRASKQRYPKGSGMHD